MTARPAPVSGTVSRASGPGDTEVLHTDRWHHGPLTDEDLRRMAAKASTLDDRLTGRFVTSSPDAADASPVAMRRAVWKQRVSRNDDAFRRRLAWDRLTDADVAGAFGRAEWTGPIPRWARVLNGCIGAFEESDALASRSAPFLDAAAPTPFEDVLAPFVQYGRSCIDHATQVEWRASAWAPLQQSLLEHLGRTASQTLFTEFQISSRIASADPAAGLPHRAGSSPRSGYDKFLRMLQRGGMRSLVQEYAALARLLGLAVMQWIDAITEMRERLDKDRAALADQFFADAPISAVTNAEMTLSDRHHNGRTVCILSLDGNRRIVYKPRSLQLEQAYATIIRWYDGGREDAPMLRAAAVLNRATYGWMEYIDAEPCANAAEAHRYFQRAGAHLACVYALGGSDMHYDNIIAGGAHPVLIDMEMLLGTSLRMAPTNQTWKNEVRDAQRLKDDTVLATHMLPFFQQIRGGVADLGGVGQRGDGDERRVLQWMNVNTDAMKMRKGPADPEDASNLPRRSRPDGRIERIEPDAYIDDIIRGFRLAYHRLLDRREDLLRDDGPLSAFDGAPVRFLFRSTSSYGLLLRVLLQPKYMRAGIDRSVHVDAISRGYTILDEKPAYWPVIASERQSLERGDVPLFQVPAGNTNLCADGEILVSNCFQASPLHVARARIQRLSPDDAHIQIGLIQTAFYLRDAADGHGDAGRATERSASRHDERGPAIGASHEPLSPAEAGNAADAIAQALAKIAIPTDDDVPLWIGLQVFPELNRLRLDPVDHLLHSGRAGIGWFLAACAAHTRSADLRALAQRTLQPVADALHDPDYRDNWARNRRMGLVNGYGGLLYGLYQAGTVMEAPDLVEAAILGARAFTPEWIAQDREYDVFFGASGALLGLLPLARESSDPGILASIHACTDHLLDAREASDLTTGRGWPGPGGTQRSGAAHGQAGIAAALARVHAHTGRTDVLPAIHDAVHFEQAAYDPDMGDWPLEPTGTTDEPQPSWCAWCRGAAGIGLCMLSIRRHLPATSPPQGIDDLIDRSVDCVLRGAPTAADHVCCGEAGRVDALLAAGRQLQRPDLVETAGRHLARMVDRAAAGPMSIGYIVGPQQSITRPGFQQGLSGIGYTLLRFANPTLPGYLFDDPDREAPPSR